MLDLRQRDKQLHLLAGILLTLGGYAFIGYLAVPAAIGVGLIKEYVVDEIWPGGCPDIWDAAATTLGALLAAACLFLLGWI